MISNLGILNNTLRNHEQLIDYKIDKHLINNGFSCLKQTLTLHFIPK